MPNIQPADERTLERFFSFLLPNLSEKTARDYKTYIRIALRENGFATLAELNENIDRVIAHYSAFKEPRARNIRAALKQYKEFIAVASLVRPNRNQSSPRRMPLPSDGPCGESLTSQGNDDIPIEDPEMGMDFLADLESQLREYMFWLCRVVQEEVGGAEPCLEENWPPVVISMKGRKKAKSSWLCEVLEFFAKNLDPRFSDDLESLQRNITRCINADVSLNCDPYLSVFVEKILLIIIGEHHLSKDGIYKKAQDYLDQLRGGRDRGRVHLINVLLGEYIDHLFDKNGFWSERPRTSVIVLYLANIRDHADNNSLDFVECIKATFAHEFFHFYHYFNVWVEFRRADVYELPSSFRVYDPGKIVKESFADYFEYSVLVCEGKRDHAQILESSWLNNDVAFWPYSGAAKIHGQTMFKELFQESIHILRDRPDDLYRISSALK